MVFFDFTSNVSGTANVRPGEDTGSEYQNASADNIRSVIGGGLVGFQPYDYYIYISGTTVNARNGKTGQIDYSASNTAGQSGFSYVAQAVASGLTNGGTIIISRNNFNIDLPVVLPNTVGRKFSFLGTPGPRGQGTTLTATTNFPTSGRYMFEVIGPAGSGTLASTALELKDLYFTNVNQFNNGIQAGGVRYEIDSPGSQMNTLYIQNCQFNLMYYGVHIIGNMSNVRMEAVRFFDVTTTFSGEFDLRIEKDYYGWENASGLAFSGTPLHKLSPQKSYFENLVFEHTGLMTNGVLLVGANLNKFVVVDMDGTKYRDSPFCFRGPTFDNQVWNLRCQDMNVNPPGNTNVASLVFDSSGCFTGGYAQNTQATTSTYAASSGGQAYACYDNKVFNTLIDPYPFQIAFQGSGFRNYVEAQNWGSNAFIKINDSGAGLYNVVRVREGSFSPNPANPSLKTSASSNTTIIDERPGATVQGSATMVSGAVSLSVSNATFDVISKVQIQPTSNTSGFTYWVSGKLSGAFSVFASPSAFSGGFSFDYNASIYP